MLLETLATDGPRRAVLVNLEGSDPCLGAEEAPVACCLLAVAYYHPVAVNHAPGL
jgi:hypothetical protein